MQNSLYKLFEHNVAVSQFQERREQTCVLVETSLAKFPWKNKLGRNREQNASL